MWFSKVSVEYSARYAKTDTSDAKSHTSSTKTDANYADKVRGVFDLATLKFFHIDLKLRSRYLFGTLLAGIGFVFYCIDSIKKCEKDVIDLKSAEEEK